VRTRFSRDPRSIKHGSEILDKALQEWLQTWRSTYSRWFRDDVKDEEVAVVREAPPRITWLPNVHSKAEMRRRPGSQYRSVGWRCRCTCSNSGPRWATSLE